MFTYVLFNVASMLEHHFFVHMKWKEATMSGVVIVIVTLLCRQPHLDSKHLRGAHQSTAGSTVATWEQCLAVKVALGTEETDFCWPIQSRKLQQVFWGPRFWASNLCVRVFYLFLTGKFMESLLRFLRSIAKTIKHGVFWQ